MREIAPPRQLRRWASFLMDKQQASWLIVRAFGVYLLIQAFFLGVRVLANVYLYSRLGSSLGAQDDYLTAMVRSYRDSMFTSVLMFLVFSATGIYFLRGGKFLMRWLQYVPVAPRHDTKAPLTEREAIEMSVKQRLSAAGLFDAFADALERRDVPEPAGGAEPGHGRPGPVHGKPQAAGAGESAGVNLSFQALRRSGPLSRSGPGRTDELEDCDPAGLGALRDELP